MFIFYVYSDMFWGGGGGGGGESQCSHLCLGWGVGGASVHIYF